MAETLGMCYDVELIYCFDKKGVLTDEGSVIPCLTPSLYEKYKQSGMIHSGMIPKWITLLNLFLTGCRRFG